MSRFVPRKERKHRINEEIIFPTLRLVGDGDSKLISRDEALLLAEKKGSDLILINENQKPPIVKIQPYNKFIYESEKAEKERKKNSLKVELKEIQLSCEIQDNDLNTKFRKSKEFISDGDKVRVSIQLKGRQKSTPERGEIVMKKFLELMSDISEVETPLKLESGKWTMILKSKKK